MLYLPAPSPPVSQVGDPIAVFPRGYPHAVMVVACANVTLRGVAAYGSTNMGVLETGGQGGNTYVDSRVIPRPHRCVGWGGGAVASFGGGVRGGSNHSTLAGRA